MKKKSTTTSQITIKTTTAAALKGDTVLCFVRSRGREQPPPVPDYPGLRSCLATAWHSGDFTAQKDQVLVAYHQAKTKGGRNEPTRLVLVGLGEDEPDREAWRQAGGTAMGRLLKTRAVAVDLPLPEEGELAAVEIAAALSEGLLLAAYRFRKYFSAPAREQAPPDEQEPALRLITIKGRRGLGPVVAGAVATATAVAEARDMANEPGNGWTPEDFALYARQLARRYDLKVTVLDRKAMEKEKMGGILAVNQGSAKSPRLVILEYRGGRASSPTASSPGPEPGKRGQPPLPTLLLVGKGLTFDAGGISLKPSSGMEEMKYDMCGGAAVLAAMGVIARERPQGLNVVAMVPATENLPGPAALKPGDIIRPYGGKSVEVINTDAEGRLILADALAYGVKKFKPSAVVDLATLTGAVIVALGHHHAGLLGNDDELCEKVRRAGQRAGEPVWRLPMGPEYRKQLKSRVADLKNIGKRDAGTILGAAFLAEFVDETPWVHLDIAGTAWNFTEKSYVPKGPSGFGVRILVELVRHWR